MLTPILATDDPYEAADAFVRAGWSLVFETPKDSGDPLACLSLAGAQVMLGTSAPQFLAPESRSHKGAGVEFHVTVPDDDLAPVFTRHREHADSTTELEMQPWERRRFMQPFWAIGS